MKSLLYILCGLLISPAVLAETWKIASLEWPPYAGKDLEGGGTAVVALREALKQKGIDIDVGFYPWERSQKYAQTPEYVGYFPAWPEEVDKGFIGSDTVQNSTVGLLYLDGKEVQWTSIDELFNKHKVGLIKSYTYPQDIEQAAQKNPKNVDYSPDEESMAKKLSSGRMEVAITDPKVMLYYAKQLNITNIKASTQTIVEKPLVVSFADRADNKPRLELLNVLLKAQ